ncbi:xylan glycosyltransferase MUCI21-like [Argentina anserina]|uniref:xylan glycosyltransferase MUCI21-like n=1 Tax=Argentina anserina TaxID=57926 RepID=UPI00217688E7|nr:xylan glycosyltransferase MUCI21-like [Potentilla anserina]
MVRYQRCPQWRKWEKHIDEDEEQTFLMEFANSGYYKRSSPKLLYLLFISLLSCSFILAPHLFSSSTTFSLLYSTLIEDEGLASDMNINAPLCSAISNGAICCDRSSIRSDICIMKGDVRTQSTSFSIFVFGSEDRSSSKSRFSGILVDNEDGENQELQHERIKPYTRKWETSVMNTIDELHLIAKKDSTLDLYEQQCDVQHDVPAVFFSTGGYTGNVYHEFNDGILPLYITSQHFNKKVVFVIQDYHKWWVMKYGDILSQLSDYPPIDFSGDKRTHCFSEATVGLRIHDELSIDSSLMERNKDIVDFRDLLDRAYWPRIRGLIQDEEREAQEKLSVSPAFESSFEFNRGVQEDKLLKKPKLLIISRNGSRAITNENLLVKMAEKIGFEVEVLRPNPTTELAKIYRALNGSDVMIGVHGAAMTHFLFMKPHSVFIQVIPLGTEWAAEEYYGEPAKKLGLKYIGYQILARESSLYGKYDRDDPVLRDPQSVNKKGWEYTKKIYLDGQTVRLNLGRFRKRLVRSYDYMFSRMNQRPHLQYSQ